MSLKLKYIVFVTALISIVSISCDKDDIIVDDIPKTIDIPEGFPEITFPTDNAYTSARWSLGKKLFYDKRLSIDSSISCGNCHQQKYGFSDNIPLTPGVHNRAATRNSPPLANVAYHPYFTREGGVPTLEMQILIPIAEHNEFGFNLVRLVDRLSKDQTYEKMAQVAYVRSLDAFSITRALSTFERSLISGNSKYDQYLSKKSKLSPMEQKGLELFFSDRTQCSTCHSGFNFTNYMFENNGLYENYTDMGRMRLTNMESDRALFKVPSLRMIGVTAPYMHDGSMQSLADVLAHYNNGGFAHPKRSPKIKKLNLDKEELKALEAFLHTLTDHEFMNNKKYSDPN